MRNKIKAAIVGAVIVAATVLPTTAANAAASSQAGHIAAAAPYCSPFVQWSGYAPFLWWLIGGRC